MINKGQARAEGKPKFRGLIRERDSRRGAVFFKSFPRQRDKGRHFRVKRLNSSKANEGSFDIHRK